MTPTPLCLMGSVWVNIGQIHFGSFSKFDSGIMILLWFQTMLREEEKISRPITNQMRVVLQMTDVNNVNADSIAIFANGPRVMCLPNSNTHILGDGGWFVGQYCPIRQTL